MAFTSSASYILYVYVPVSSELLIAQLISHIYNPILILQREFLWKSWCFEVISCTYDLGMQDRFIEWYIISPQVKDKLATLMIPDAAPLVYS